MVKTLSNKFSSIFLKGNERTLLLKKNIAISFLLKGCTLAIGLVLVPITINYINPVQYGIWLTLSSIITWFSLFDIGLGNGLKNKLAETNALGETIEARAYISTTYAIVSLIAVVLFFLFLLSNVFLNWNNILNTNNISGGNLKNLALIVFGCFCIQLILQLINSVLTAFHAISKVSVIRGIGQVVTLVCIYILTKTTTSSLLYVVIIFAGLPVLVQLAANIWLFKKSYAKFSPGLKFIDFKHAKKLLQVGGVFFFIQIGTLILFETDNIVITQLFGPKKVTDFNINYKLFSLIIVAFTIIMDPIWPAFTDAYTKGDMDWIKGIFKKMYKYWFGLIVISIALLVASPWLFKLWVGNNVNISFAASISMVLYVISSCWLMIHNFFINGIGKMRLQLYLYIISTIINIPLAIVLGKSIGVAGVILSNTIIVLSMGIVFYIQCKKILNNTATGVWNK